MIWKDWARDSRYEVSENGNVRNKSTGRVLRPFVDRRGVNLFSFTYQGRGRKTWKAHRIVAEVFIGVSDMYVNHKDLNPSNNHFSNLEYCTPLENTRHALRNGVVMGGGIGEKNGSNRYSEKEMIQVRKLLRLGVSRSEIAKRTGVHRDMVRLVDIGKNWTHLK